VSYLTPLSFCRSCRSRSPARRGIVLSRLMAPLASLDVTRPPHLAGRSHRPERGVFSSSPRATRWLLSVTTRTHGSPFFFPDFLRSFPSRSRPGKVNQIFAFRLNGVYHSHRASGGKVFPLTPLSKPCFIHFPSSSGFSARVWQSFIRPDPWFPAARVSRHRLCDNLALRHLLLT